jgi:hypothetical protein
MYTVLLPPGGYQIAVNKYIIACLIFFHWMVGFCKEMKTSLPLGVQKTNVSIPIFFDILKMLLQSFSTDFFPSFLPTFQRSFFPPSIIPYVCFDSPFVPQDQPILSA